MVYQSKAVLDVESETSEPDFSVSEAQLIEEVRKGNIEGFSELVSRYEQRLIRVIYRFVDDWFLAEDLAQDTFIRVYERLHQFDASRRFGPWLMRVGVNLALDYLRKQKRRGFWSLFSESNSEKPPDPGVPDPQEQMELNQEIRAVLNQIPENYRTVLILRDLEGFSSSEVAAILHRKEATIRWRLAEARSRFREVWEKRLQHSSDDE